MSKLILGIDFPSAHRLLVDPFARAVLFADSLKAVSCTGLPRPFLTSSLLSAPSWRLFPALCVMVRGRHGRIMESDILLRHSAARFMQKPATWIQTY
jgi:hypothetical protein